MTFTIIGGAGGQRGYGGGRGAIITGQIPITGGAELSPIAGGAGADSGAQGTSTYWTGGTAVDSQGGGGGGAGSGLYIAGTLVGIAGGGGGGANYGVSSSQDTTLAVTSSDDNSAADNNGKARYVRGSETDSGYLAVSGGGGKGTDTAGGTAGQYGGYTVSAGNGNAATGSQGADGVAAARLIGGIGSSGAGGGGSFGGGSGATLYYFNTPNNWGAAIAGGGGGGSSLVSDSATNVNQAISSDVEGSVVVSFS